MSEDIEPAFLEAPLIVVDYRSNLATFKGPDGDHTTFRLANNRSGSALKRSCLDLRAGTLRMEFDSIGEVEADVLVDAQHSSVPIVYLDQLHWISLARALSGTRMPKPEREAAIKLIRLAESRKVVLPLSGAHATEMSKTTGKWRRDLASVMLRYSRGWQMLSPISVRRAELRQLFQRRLAQSSAIDLHQSEVFTLRPRALWADAQNGAWTPPSEFPVALQAALRQITWIEAFFSVLAEDEENDQTRGIEIAKCWADSHQELANSLRGNTRAQVHKRAITRIRFLADIKDDLVGAAKESGMSDAQFDEWLLSQAEEDLSSLPYLGRIREVVHHRLSNSQDRWEPNDVNDTLFLPCAAAYADLIVSEKKFGEYLRRAGRAQGSPAPVFATLSQAVSGDHLANL